MHPFYEIVNCHAQNDFFLQLDNKCSTMCIAYTLNTHDLSRAVSSTLLDLLNFAFANIGTDYPFIIFVVVSCISTVVNVITPY